MKRIACVALLLPLIPLACGGDVNDNTFIQGAGGATADSGDGSVAGSAGADESTGGTNGAGGSSAGGSGGTVDSGTPCVAGQQIACACMGGLQGVQACKPDGSGYGLCACPDASALGGSAGEGGSAGAGGAPLACVPGQQSLCACSGGLQGVQTCKSDGSGYDPCACPDGGPACVPGQQIHCPCPGSSQGVQVCNGDGTGYEACQCAEAGAGGAGGWSPCSMDCAGTLPTVMVHLPEGYSIDSTEVTRCQYKVWLDSHPSTAGQPPRCALNTDFAPNEGCMTNSWIYWGQGCEDHPQPCVDWCDAYAYCKAVGKRLCGKIGGGPLNYSDYASAAKSQWHNACVSGAAANAYPYGTTYDGLACNGSDFHLYSFTPVGSMGGCQSHVSGYEGVYDLSGNVWEWEDACDDSFKPVPHCRVRGGASVCFSDSLRCDADYYLGSDFTSDAGIRCCSDP